MRLVDGEKRHGNVRNKRQKALVFEPLRRDIQKLILLACGFGVSLPQLFERQGAIEKGRRNARLRERRDLILHERDERRDDDREPRQHKRGDLVADRFSAARRHDTQNVPAGQNRVDERLLPAAEGTVTKELFQQRPFFQSQSLIAQPPHRSVTAESICDTSQISSSSGSWSSSNALSASSKMA